MMLTVLLLAAQAAPAAAAPVPALGDDTQLSCTLVGPSDRAPSALALDFRSRRQANATLAFSAESPFARVGSTSAVQRRPDGTAVIGFATGNGQYRLELTPQRQAVRLRVVNAVDRITRLTVAQGFCAVRRGRKLGNKPVPPLTVEDMAVARPWKLAPLPSRLPDGTCRLVTQDQRTHQLGYQITVTRDNELSAAYRFGTADLTGAPAQSGAGTQFYLVTPAERLVATTIGLPTTPAIYVHITYERMGNFIDLRRNGEVFAVGECGAPPLWVAAPAGAPQ